MPFNAATDFTAITQMVRVPNVLVMNTERAKALHISNVHAREAFRHHSYIAPVAKAVICGLGVQGYSIAIDAVAQVLLAPAA